MKFLLYSRGFFEREKTVASRLHTRRTMRFVTRTITIGECKRAVFITRGSIAFFHEELRLEAKRERERERRWRIGYLFPDLSLFRHNYIAVARHAN